MIQGRVSGKIWSSRRIPSLPSGALLEVEMGSGRLIAFDPLGCALGETVLVVQGSVASAYFPGETAPVDALIVASIDEETAKQTSGERNG